MLTSIRRWWGRPDHFYWVTAFLAARRANVAFRYAMSAALGVVALLIIATIGSPSGPQGTINRLIAVGVGVCAAVLAAGTLAVRRPSPRMSTVFVVVSTTGISALCLVQSAPLAGMLASSGFAVLGGYIGFFHTPRLLTLNLAVTVATTLALGWRLADAGDPAMAVTASGFLLLVNLATPFACQGLVHLLGIDALNADIDPLTGLSNRQAFYRDAATFIATRDRADDRHFVLVYVSLDGWDALPHKEGLEAADCALVDAAQALRDTTRHDAVTGHLSDADFLVADCFATPDATPLVERLRGAISTPSRSTVSIGVVSAPMAGLAECPPQGVLDELIAVAGTAMGQARRDGPNEARHVVYPDITAGGG